jgi:hypothetical protein
MISIEQLEAAVVEQPSHAVVPRVRLRVARGVGGAGERIELLVEGGDRWVPVSMEMAVGLLEKRRETIELMESDHFNHGYEPAAWDEIDWEIVKLRVRNPGVVIQVLVCGANGSGKTFYCTSRMMQFLTQTRHELVWSYSLDEPNSKVINQKWTHWYLPNEYKTEKGSVKRTGTAKLNHNEAGGFTNNTFSLHSGSTCDFRFYSKDIATLEGPRPAFVWMDEEFNDAWLDGVERRLLTHAGRTRDHMGMWRKLLAEKMKDESGKMKFPRELFHKLLLGVQLISFTPKSGYTPTVRAFVKGAVVRRTVAAELLPVQDEQGNVTGCEEMPKLLYCSRENRIVYYLHAWDNPIGGNWEGMKKLAAGKPKKTIKWWCYGVAEETSGVMYPKFSRRAHVRPIWMLPREGTWYLVADPNQVGRNWFMSWTKVNALGERFMAREWPEQDDHIPGEGYPGPWALPPTGKRVDGDEGPAQRTFGRGNQFIAEEIKRAEQELYWIERRLEELRKDGVTEFTWEMFRPPLLPADAPRIKVAERYMDARAANTETMTHGASRTLVEVFEEDYKLSFEPVDKDHGAIEGARRSVGHGAKFVEDALDYDEKLAVFDEATGFLNFKGKAPRLYICGAPPPVDNSPPRGCENIIFAFETWTNQDGGEGACKDAADQPRYLEMMGVRDVSGVEMSSSVRARVKGQGSSGEGEIGDWGRS